MNIWIKNSKGNRDAMLTFAFIGFLVCMIKVLFGGTHQVLFGYPIDLTPIDAATIGAILTPTLGAYTARRWNDHKAPKDKEPV
jgi:NhaP-type Na+/H+ or K+/H+ antiporter